MRFGVLAAFAGYSCFLALIQIFCLYFGVIGIALNKILAVTVLILSILLSCLIASRFREPVVENFVLSHAAGRGARIFNGLFKTFAACLLLWAGWVWLQLWVLASLRPPYDWDGLYYHIPAIHEWVLAGRVSWIESMPDVAFVNFPMGVEVHSFLMHYVLNTSDFLDACNLWYWPLAFLALVIIATRLGARGVYRWTAGALIVGAPIFVSQSVSCYIDPGFSSTVMASIAASCIFIFSGRRSMGWKTILLGINVGLMAGSKGTGFPFAVVFLVAVLAGIFYVHGFDFWKVWLRRVFVCGVVVAAVGGYWYARNTVKTGNPLYPIQLKLGDYVLIKGYDYMIFNNVHMPPWLEKYPPGVRTFVSWLQLDAPISGFDPVGGMGYVWLAGALPALFYLWVQFLRKRKRSEYPIREFTFLTFLVLLLLFVQPAQWWARFTVWLHALGLPCFAVVWYHAISRWHISRRNLITVVLCLVVLCVVVWESNTTLRIEWVTGRNPRADTIRDMFVTSQEHMFWGMDETQGFDAFFNVPVIARSYSGGMGSLFVGVLAMPLGQREITVLPLEPDGGDVASLREAGVEWIVWDVLGAGEVPEILAREAREKHVYQPGSDTNLHFIRI